MPAVLPSGEHGPHRWLAAAVAAQAVTVASALAVGVRAQQHQVLTLWQTQQQALQQALQARHAPAVAAAVAWAVRAQHNHVLAL